MYKFFEILNQHLYYMNVATHYNKISFSQLFNLILIQKSTEGHTYTMLFISLIF